MEPEATSIVRRDVPKRGGSRAVWLAAIVAFSLGAGLPVMAASGSGTIDTALCTSTWSYSDVTSLARSAAVNNISNDLCAEVQALVESFGKNAVVADPSGSVSEATQAHEGLGLREAKTRQRNVTWIPWSSWNVHN